MNPLLAGLLGGAGAGLSSYGQSAMREQEVKQAQIQRMKELAEQEASRRRLQSEDDARALAAQTAKRASGVATLKALYPDAQLPDGADPDAYLRAKQIDDTNTRSQAGIDAAMARLKESLGGRLDQIERQGSISSAIADSNNTARMAMTKLTEAGKNARDLTPNAVDPNKAKSDWLIKRATELMNGGALEPGVDANTAKARATQEASLLFGGAPPTASVRPDFSGERDLMTKAQQKIQSIMGDGTLSPDDKQDMVRQVNDILRQRLTQMRGGR